MDDDLLTWDEYVDEALKTAPDQPAERQLVQGALGLVGETEEYAAVPSPEEAGDCWYYVALMADAHTVGFSLHYSGNSYRIRCGASYAAQVAERVESYVFQKSTGHGRRSVAGAMNVYVDWLTDQSLKQATPREIWTANIDKLRDRHGTSHPAQEGDDD